MDYIYAAVIQEFAVFGRKMIVAFAAGDATEHKSLLARIWLIVLTTIDFQMNNFHWMLKENPAQQAVAVGEIWLHTSIQKMLGSLASWLMQLHALQQNWKIVTHGFMGNKSILQTMIILTCAMHDAQSLHLTDSVRQSTLDEHLLYQLEVTICCVENSHSLSL